MASNTRIIILHMKELLFTLIFLVLALILLFLFIHMLSVRKDPVPSNPTQTTTYTSDAFWHNPERNETTHPIA